MAVDFRLGPCFFLGSVVFGCVVVVAISISVLV